MKYLLVVTVLGMVALSARSTGDQSLPARGSVLSSGNGRFAFGQISDFRRDQFMLDTQNGRLWMVVKIKNDTEVLRAVYYMSEDDIASILPPDQDQTLRGKLHSKSEQVPSPLDDLDHESNSSTSSTNVGLQLGRP